MMNEDTDLFCINYVERSSNLMCDYFNKIPRISLNKNVLVSFNPFSVGTYFMTSNVDSHTKITIKIFLISKTFMMILD